MFGNYKTPTAFAKIEDLADRLKKLAVLRHVYLVYSHNDGTYRLTYDEWGASPTDQAVPVFEARSYREGELIDRLQKELGLLELDWRLDDEEEALQRYVTEDTRDFLDVMTTPSNRAMINMLARQVDQ